MKEEKRRIKTEERVEKQPFLDGSTNIPPSSWGVIKRLASSLKNREASEKDKEMMNPYLKATVSTALLIAVLGILVVLIRRLSPEWYKWLEELIKHNEIILVIALAVIGIYYAIKAMLEAAAALKESQKIYTAISSFFDNYDQATGRIDSILSEADKELLVLVSLPAYGLIVDKELGDKFYSVISERITNCKTGNLEIKFICFSPTLCEKFEDEFRKRDAQLYNVYEVYKQEILQGLYNVRSLRRQKENSSATPPTKPYENLWMLSEDTHIRLIIADDKKAFFATVPDFDERNPQETNIAGFETTEKKMISILRKLFYEQMKSCSPVSESDFKSYLPDKS